MFTIKTIIKCNFFWVVHSAEEDTTLTTKLLYFELFCFSFSCWQRLTSGAICCLYQQFPSCGYNATAAKLVFDLRNRKF